MTDTVKKKGTPSPSDDKYSGIGVSKYNFTRKHIRITALVITIAFLAAFGGAVFLGSQMKDTSTSVADFKTVEALIMTAEPEGKNSQKLGVIWSYDNNSKVSTTDVIALGSSDKYVKDNTVSILYKPSQFDENTPDGDQPRFLVDQYDQQNVVTFVPWIIALSVTALVILGGGISTYAFMRRHVEEKETWG